MVVAQHGEEVGEDAEHDSAGQELEDADAIGEDAEDDATETHDSVFKGTYMYNITWWK